MKNNPALRYGLVACYLASLAWYAYGVKEALGAARSAEPYPFLLDLDNISSTFFYFAGTLWWFVFGLDRSKTIEAVAGYVLAGAHVLLFAIQVVLGPMIWLNHNLI